MKRPIVILHPLLVFVSSILTLALAYFLYINWYLKIKDSLEKYWQTFPPNGPLKLEIGPFWPIFTSAILLLIIIAGLITIFIYYQKTNDLYRRQETFINNFTHELKTPVASIRLYLETFLKHDLKTEDIKKFSSYMLKDTQRLSTHIGQILQIARLENKKEKYQLNETDLNQFIKSFIKENSYLFLEAKIHETMNPVDKFTVKINKDLFEMVLMNILTNALIHNHQQKPEISINIEQINQQVVLSISDNGIGLSKIDIKKIFKKFYQANSSKLARKRGSGLGLYLTQQIVKLHKGSIMALSQGTELGTTITIKLPTS